MAETKATCTRCCLVSASKRMYPQSFVCTRFEKILSTIAHFTFELSVWAKMFALKQVNNSRNKNLFTINRISKVSQVYVKAMNFICAINIQIDVIWMGH